MATSNQVKKTRVKKPESPSVGLLPWTLSANVKLPGRAARRLTKVAMPTNLLQKKHARPVAKAVKPAASSVDSLT